VSAAINSSSINHDKFPLLRPLMGLLNQFCSDRIFLHVFPFLAVTLVIAQKVIEKSGLPQGPLFSRAHRD
jgi:hypothetical protein